MKKSNKKYRSVIIGCGSIAGGYDNPGDINILTHAHAIFVHPKVILSGVYDISYEKACWFAKKWRTIPFVSLRAIFESTKPDIVYVCVPDKEHVRTLEKILDYRPLAVVCEKPLSLSINKSKAIINKYHQEKIALAVNYSRRYDPIIINLKKDIKRQKYGEFLKASVIYTKGILHNGSHVVDILRYLFGEVRSYHVLSRNVDYLRSDPSLDAFLEFCNGNKAHLITGDENSYSVFEMDLLFAKARIRFDQFGLRYSIQKIRHDPVFPGYKDLGELKIKSTGLNKATIRLLDNLVNHIEKKEALLCSGEEALATQEICIKLLGNNN